MEKSGTDRFNVEFDIVKNIAAIEKLKSDLLSGTAELFKGMTVSDTSVGEQKECLSEIIIAAYLLSGRLGIEFKEIDQAALKKLKAGLLEASPLSKEKSLLYKFMNRSNESI